MFATGTRRLIVGLFLWAVCSAQVGGEAPRPKTSPKTWGPYRSGSYLGIRPMIPETLLFGLMWANGDDQSGVLSTLRDTCEQDDGIEDFGWTSYELRLGGTQVIHDKKLEIDLTTDFSKAKDGQSWIVRVRGVPRKGAPADLKTALVFHLALENAENATRQRNVWSFNNRTDDGQKARKPPTGCRGKLPEIGGFDFWPVWDTEGKVVSGPAIKTVNVTEDKIWQARAVYKETLEKFSKENTLIDGPGVGNLHFHQVVFEGPFSMFYVYRSNDWGFTPPDQVDLIADLHQSAFSNQTLEVFSSKTPFMSPKYATFSESLMANLLGSMGYFHGDEVVDESHANEYEETDLNFWNSEAKAMAEADTTMTNATSLISFVPSRPFFPRGFLWDEGFHLLPVIEWDLPVAILVLKDWLSQMDADGWVARERILGPEARNRVPKKFQTQYPHFANPPTFLAIALPSILSKLSNSSTYRGRRSKYTSDREEGLALVGELFPLFLKQYNWFRKTQGADFSAEYARPEGANTEGYRWRGRTPGHCLTSGLDDYPRAEPPHPGELHVDALAWVGASARALQQAADFLEKPSSVFSEQAEAAKHNLDAVHWDAKSSAYCDATVGDDGTFQHVCHLGYLSLMPLLTGLMDEDHPNLPAVLDLIADPKRLWSSHGLRSLSSRDENYGKDENYWRGAVWMNLNVLAVLQLRDLGNSTAQGLRARSLAAKLRKNIINTVYDSWERTGFVWEQYNDKTGQGQRSKAFTGWTATVLLLMSLEDAVVEPEGSYTQAISWTISLVVLIFGSWVCRRRLLVMYDWAVTKLRLSFDGYHRLGQGGAPLETTDLEDLYEADAEEDGR